MSNDLVRRDVEEALNAAKAQSAAAEVIYNEVEQQREIADINEAALYERKKRLLLAELPSLVTKAVDNLRAKGWPDAMLKLLPVGTNVEKRLFCRNKTVIVYAERATWLVHCGWYLGADANFYRRELAVNGNNVLVESLEDEGIARIRGIVSSLSSLANY